MTSHEAIISARVFISAIGAVAPGGSALPGVVPDVTSARFAALSPALAKPVAFVEGAPMAPLLVLANRAKGQMAAIDVTSFIVTLPGSALQGPRNARMRIGPVPCFERAITKTSILAGLQLIVDMLQ